MHSKMVNNYKIVAFTSKKEFLEQIRDERKILVALNAEKILKEDEKLRDIVNRNIGYPDGIGAVLALRRKGLDTIKIPGSEFWLDIVNEFYKEKRFYLVGSTDEVIESTVKKLRKEYPDIDIVGYRNGFFNEDDKERLIDILTEKKPDVVFVAQGSPRQEFLMDELIRYHCLWKGTLDGCSNR